MLLEQILRRQEEYIRSIGPVAKPEVVKPAKIKKSTSKKIAAVCTDLTVFDVFQIPLEETVSPVEIPSVPEPALEIPEPVLEISAIPEPVLEIPSFEVLTVPNKGMFDLPYLRAKYVPKKGVKVPAKTMGLAVPEELHTRMAKFLEDHKKNPGAPTSLRELGLMCLGFAMDNAEKIKH